MTAVLAQTAITPRALVLEGSTTTLDVACPNCGWDDSGDLRLRDWYAEEFPPIPPPRTREGRLQVVGDPDPGSFTGHCRRCDEELEADNVIPRADGIELADMIDLARKALQPDAPPEWGVEDAMMEFYGHGSHDDEAGDVDEVGVHLVLVGRFVQSSDTQGVKQTTVYPSVEAARAALEAVEKVTIQIQDTPSGRLLARAVEIMRELGCNMGDAMERAKAEAENGLLRDGGTA